MQRFTDKIALVTGAASGIGRATAQRLFEEGASVMIADINEEGLAAVAQALGDEARVATMRLDAADPQQCRDLVAATVARFGRLDVLCNIAGIAMARHMTDISEAEWMRMVNINMNSVFFMSQAAMPHLIESKGNIVNMASTAALVGQIYNAAYCATKGAVLLMSKSMAVEFADRGVRVNAVCPGSVNTALTENFSLPDNPNMDAFKLLMPLLDSAEASEIGAAVAYLASDEARFVTGSSLVIDGGQTAA